MINVYPQVLCVKAIAQKVMTYVVTSVCPRVKCKTIIPAIHVAFLKTFMKSIGGLVMVTV